MLHDEKEHRVPLEEATEHLGYPKVFILKPDPPRTDEQFQIIEQENDHYRPLADKNLIRRIKERLKRVEGGGISPEFQFLSLGETRQLFKLLGL